VKKIEKVGIFGKKNSNPEMADPTRAPKKMTRTNFDFGQKSFYIHFILCPFLGAIKKCSGQT